MLCYGDRLIRRSWIMDVFSASKTEGRLVCGSPYMWEYTYIRQLASEALCDSTADYRYWYQISQYFFRHIYWYWYLLVTCVSGFRGPTSSRVYCENCTKTVRQPIFGGCCLYSFTNSSASFSSCMYRNAWKHSHVNNLHESLHVFDSSLWLLQFTCLQQLLRVNLNPTPAKLAL